MSKLTKTVGKWKLWTVVSAIIVAAGIIVAAIFGFNADYTASDVKTMTVKLDSYVSVSDVKMEKVKDICESALEKAGLKDAYTMDGETSGGGELVYVFSAKTDDKKLAEVKTAVESALETATADSGELAGAILYVTANSERAAATLAAGYLWRAALAGAVVLLAEFIYIAIRYKLNMGAAAAISSLTGTLLTVALVALVRLPVTASLAYAGAFALLYTTVTSMLALNKMRENFKTDEYKEKSADEAIVSSLPVKTILAFAAVSAVALVLVGAIAVASVRWFAIASLIGVLAGTFASLIFMPAIYLPLKKLSDKRAAERARYDYKKSGKDKKEDAPKEDGKAAPTQA